MTKRMKRLFWGSTIFLLLVLLGFGPAAQAEPEAAGPGNGGGSPAEKQAGSQPRYDDYARFLAGRPTPGGSLADDEKTAAWSRYAESMQRSWQRFESRQLKPMREWASKELAGVVTDTVFYPFSGPDFVNAYNMFPRAKTYLLVALEPVGELPEAGEMGAEYLASLQRSLYHYFHIDFFGTKRMKAQIAQSELKGVLPILLCFLSREDLRVLDVRHWLMRPDGSVAEQAADQEADGGPGIPGLRLVFQAPGAAEPQALYFVHLNLQNQGCGRQPHFVSFLKGFGPLTTFTKAASYLLYGPNFSELRQFILERSQCVVQGDSGIPLKYLDPAVWNLKFYGKYRGPLAMFSHKRQPELAAAYQNGKDVYPLPFGFGYHYRAGTGNLLLAARKSGENLK